MIPLFSNLISNAIKYSQKNSHSFIHIRSDLAKSKISENGIRKEFCRIYIADNGIGFEQKYAKEVFDMFRRLHPGAEYEGTGIGLALCKKIVEKHGGHISVNSSVNEGSTFILSLPVVNPLNELERIQNNAESKNIK
jgi:signal transduction histidine kinase